MEQLLLIRVVVCLNSEPLFISQKTKVLLNKTYFTGPFRFRLTGVCCTPIHFLDEYINPVFILHKSSIKAAIFNICDFVHNATAALDPQV